MHQVLQKKRTPGKVYRAIPAGILNAIRTTSGEGKEAQELTRLTSYILGKYYEERIPFDEPIEISREHFRNQIGTHYLQKLDILKDAGIIHTDNSYYYFNDTRKGKCKSYLFHPDLVYTDPAIIEIDATNKKRFANDFVTRQTVELLSKTRLSVDRRNLPKFIKKFVNYTFIRERCKINNEIPPGEYILRGNVTPKDRDFYLEVAESINYDLILYKDRLHIEPSKLFIQRKMIETRNAYLNSLLKIKGIRRRININCGRNSTNGRLDTNLTNLKEGLLDLVTLDGEKLLNIDLKNSQFTLLSFLIEHINNFYHLTNKFRAANYTSNSNIEEVNLSTSISNLYTESKILSIINVTQFIREKGQKLSVTGSFPKDLTLFQKLTKSGVFTNIWPTY
jgi:hypothetical protein